VEALYKNRHIILFIKLQPAINFEKYKKTAGKTSRTKVKNIKLQADWHMQVTEHMESWKLNCLYA
jgi:hypothetical protein